MIQDNPSNQQMLILKDFFLLLQNKHNYKYKLTSQLRCKGGNDYIQYIQNILNCKQKVKNYF